MLQRQLVVDKPMRARRDHLVECFECQAMKFIHTLVGFWSRMATWCILYFKKNWSLTINCFYYSEQLCGTWYILSNSLAHFINIISASDCLLRFPFEVICELCGEFLEVCSSFPSLWGGNKYWLDVCDYYNDCCRFSLCPPHLSLPLGYTKKIYLFRFGLH